MMDQALKVGAESYHETDASIITMDDTAEMVKIKTEDEAFKTAGECAVLVTLDEHSQVAKVEVEDDFEGIYTGMVTNDDITEMVKLETAIFQDTDTITLGETAILETEEEKESLKETNRPIVSQGEYSEMVDIDMENEKYQDINANMVTQDEISQYGKVKMKNKEFQDETTRLSTVTWDEISQTIQVKVENEVFQDQDASLDTWDEISQILKVENRKDCLVYSEHDICYEVDTDTCSTPAFQVTVSDDVTGTTPSNVFQDTENYVYEQKRFSEIDPQMTKVTNPNITTAEKEKCVAVVKKHGPVRTNSAVPMETDEVVNIKSEPLSQSSREETVVKTEVKDFTDDEPDEQVESAASVTNSEVKLDSDRDTDKVKTEPEIEVEVITPPVNEMLIYV